MLPYEICQRKWDGKEEKKIKRQKSKGKNQKSGGTDATFLPLIFDF
jgi:hypothetical protein